MNGAIDLFLRAIPILIGGGAVQLIIHLIKRRAENRSMNAASLRSEAESGSFVVESARASLTLSDQVRDRAVKYAEIKEAEAQALAQRVRELQDRLSSVEATLAGVEVLRQEVADLRAENAQLRTEVEICHRTHPNPA